MVSIAACPGRDDAGYNTTAVYLALEDDDWENDGTDAADVGAFGRTGLLQTTRTIANLAGDDTAEGMANFDVTACGDMAGFSNPQITLTIMGTPSATGLVESATKAGKRGDISVGSPLMIHYRQR